MLSRDYEELRVERPTKLFNYINAHERKLFVWGKNDCFTFTLGWIKEATGRDVWGTTKDWQEIAKDYDNEEAAMSLLELFGGREKAEACLGESIHISLAVAGDIVCGDLSDGETLGICLGLDSVFLGLRGIITMRTLELEKAWRV